MYSHCSKCNQNISVHSTFMNNIVMSLFIKHYACLCNQLQSKRVLNIIWNTEVVRKFHYRTHTLLKSIYHIYIQTGDQYSSLYLFIYTKLLLNMHLTRKFHRILDFLLTIFKLLCQCLWCFVFLDNILAFL